MDYPKISGEYQEIEGYRLIPIRMEDRESIRIWRNEQMFHLRQKQALSEDDQIFIFLCARGGMFWLWRTCTH